MRLVVLVRIAVALVWTTATLSPGLAALYEPRQVTFHTEPPKGCGLRADYALSGATLRVELVVWRTAGGSTIAARAYQPNSVGPLLRDIWLKSASLFSLGRFRPGRENSNGILETRGDLAHDQTTAFLEELKQGKIEISIIFDGVMPMARLPIGLPTPLPPDVASDIAGCLDAA